MRKDSDLFGASWKRYRRPNGFVDCARLFDERGCISMDKNYVLTLRLSTTDMGMPKRMQELFKAGTLKQYGHGPDRKPPWVWFCGAKGDVIRILHELEPYLCRRSKQGALAWHFLENPNLTPNQQRLIYEALGREKVRRRKLPKVNTSLTFGNGG